jgi:hypothetical protein
VEAAAEIKAIGRRLPFRVLADHYKASQAAISFAVAGRYYADVAPAASPPAWATSHSEWRENPTVWRSRAKRRPDAELSIGAAP